MSLTPGRAPRGPKDHSAWPCVGRRRAELLSGRAAHAVL